MSSIKKNFALNTLYQVLAILLPLITAPYLARVIGAAGTGVYSYKFSIAKYFTIFAMLGLNNYGNRTIAAVRDNKAQLSKEFTSIYIMQLVLHLLVLSAYVIYAWFFAGDLVSKLLTLYVLSSLFDINWFFFGLEQFKLTVVRNTIIKLCSVACILLFVKEKNDVWKYVLIMACSFLFSQMMLWPFLKRYTSFSLISIGDVIKHLRPNIVLFIPVVAVSLYKTMDKVMLGAMTVDEQVGYYDNCESLIAIPLALVQSLGNVMLPRMSNLFAKGNSKEISTKYINTSIVFATFLATSISFGIMTVSKEFVPLFYGSGFETCVPILLVLCPSVFFTAIGNVIRTQLLIPQKKDKEYIISVFIGAIVNLILNALLIPQYSAVGASLGTLAAEISVCIYQIVSSRKDIIYKQAFEDSLPMIIAAIMMFIILFNIRMPIDNNLLALVSKIILGIITYVIFAGGGIIIRNLLNAERKFLRY